MENKWYPFSQMKRPEKNISVFLLNEKPKYGFASCLVYPKVRELVPLLKKRKGTMKASLRDLYLKYPAICFYLLEKEVISISSLSEEAIDNLQRFNFEKYNSMYPSTSSPSEVPDFEGITDVPDEQQVEDAEVIELVLNGTDSDENDNNESDDNTRQEY